MSYLAAGLILSLAIFAQASQGYAQSACAKSAVEAQISDAEKFVRRFGAVPVNATSAEDRILKIYTPFVQDLMRIDFNNEPVRGVHSRSQQNLPFVLAPWIVSGWRTLGLVTPAGRFNTDITIEQLMGEFARHSGMQVISSPGGILPVAEFFAYLRARQFFPDDIHSVLFHLPFLVDAPRREVLLTLLDVLEFDREWRLADMSNYWPGERNRLLDMIRLFFEGPTKSVGRTPTPALLRPEEFYLCGGAQIEFGMGCNPGIGFDDANMLADVMARRERLYHTTEMYFTYANLNVSPRLEMRSLISAFAQEVKNWRIGYQAVWGHSVTDAQRVAYFEAGAGEIRRDVRGDDVLEEEQVQQQRRAVFLMRMSASRGLSGEGERFMKKTSDLLDKLEQWLVKLQ